jgi:hypothetical protein
MFTTDASDPAATLTIAGGNLPEARVGEPLARRMWVKITDGQGEAVPNVSVQWTSDGGPGMLHEGCPWTYNWNGTIATTRTLPDGALMDGEGGAGFAWVRFRPLALGSGTVLASVRGLTSSAAIFTVETTTLLIRLGPDFGLGIRFIPGMPGPVPVGTPVEFRNDLLTARIQSTLVPPGGEPFDSGQLGPGARFSFVPGVAGLWRFVDETSGALGGLMVQ